MPHFNFKESLLTDFHRRLVANLLIFALGHSLDFVYEPKV